jgi:chromosome segregation ATPase
MKTAISVLEKEINELKTNIDYLENKNKEHQGVIDANNEVIYKLNFVINDLQNGYDLINNQTYNQQ